MRIELLYQGYKISHDKSVGTKIFDILETEKVEKLTILTAFTSESIVRKFFAFIERKNIQVGKIRIITGIDQKGTSKEALESLSIQENIEARVFFSSTPNIFHPKIYLFETKERTFAIIGSANFTQQGLFINIESSIYIEVANDVEEEYKIIKELKEYFSILESDNDPNLYHLNEGLIADLDSRNLLPTREEIFAEIRKLAKSKGEVKSTYPTRDIPKLPDYLKNIVPRSARSRASEPTAKYETSRTVWISSPLTERDLNVPKGGNTNITGDMNIDKGVMSNEVDYRHYYREDVFRNLPWKKSTRRGSEHLDETIANFEIIIDGQSQGSYDLKLSHNPRVDVQSYIQKNAMTKLKWGAARAIVAKSEYLGKTLRIKKTDLDGKYLIEIA